MDCSTPVFPVLHHLPEFAQTCPLSWFLSLTQSHVSLEFRLSCFDLHWSACSFTQQMLPGPHCVPGTVWPHTDGGKDADTGQRLAVRAQLLAQAQPLGRGQQKAVRRHRRVSTPGPGASTVSGSGAPSPVGVAPSCLAAPVFPASPGHLLTLLQVNFVVAQEGSYLRSGASAAE